MRIWFDTEFIDNGKTIDLISIGMVREDGNELYLQNVECDRSKACDWVKENVFPGLDDSFNVSKSLMRQQIFEFAEARPKFWAYYAAYDWVVLCQLFGRMIDVPKGWPMYCRDVKQLIGNKPIMSEPTNKHNALSDALWIRDIHINHERNI